MSSINWFPRCGGCSSRNASTHRSLLQGIAPCVYGSTTSSMLEPKLLASPENFADISPICSVIIDLTDSTEEDPLCCDFPVDELPDHILIGVFGFFRPQDICKTIAPVCHKWYDLAYSSTLWRLVDMQISTFRHQWHVKRVLSKMAPAIWKLSFFVKDEPLSCPAVIAQGTIPHLPSLTVLDLGFNKGLEIAVIDFFVDQCPNMVSVNVEGSKEITDKSVYVMASGWSYLENVCLSHCVNVTDSGICLLTERVKRLKVLNIDGISSITDNFDDSFSAVESLVIHNGQNLERLYLDGADLTDMSLFFLSDCTKLNLLSISFGESLTDTSLNYLKTFKSLDHLHLRKGLDFTVEGLKSLFESGTLKNLRFLNLAECSAINDTCVSSLTRNCPKLEALCLSWCWSVTDPGLQTIVRRLKNLVLLDLVGLDLVRGHILAHIPEIFLPKIKFIDLRQCNVIEDAIVIELVKRKQDLTVANYYGELWNHDSVLESNTKKECIDREHLKHLIDSIKGGCCMTAI